MSGDILDLIDNAIEAHERWPDAMRWTPEAPTEPDGLPEISFGFRRELPVGHLTIIDETHAWTEDMVRRAEQLLDGLGAELTEWQREVLRTTHPRMRPFRRLFLNQPAVTEEER